MTTRDELMHQYWEVTQEIDKLGGDLKLDTYAAPHVWNLVAKTLREHYALLMIAEKPNDKDIQSRRRSVEDLALLFAKRFVQDANFDPISWLDKCSPDPIVYPFSELWNEQ